MDDGPVPPAPLVEGPFGDRLPVLRGLLPSWEVYIFVGIGLGFNTAIVEVLVQEYVLCPDRKLQAYIVGPDWEEYADVRVCTLAGSGAYTVIVMVLMALCAFGTSAPYARWKAKGLPKPRYPLTVGQEYPQIYDSIRNRQELLEKGKQQGEFYADVDEELRNASNVATWPAYVSWDERPMGLTAKTFLIFSPILLLAVNIYEVAGFLFRDLSQTWGPERRDHINEGVAITQVPTPHDRRDDVFVGIILFGSAFSAGVVAMMITLVGSASMLRKGYYLRPQELGSATCGGLSGVHYYDPTPILEGGAPERRSTLRNQTPLGPLFTTQHDGNP